MANIQIINTLLTNLHILNNGQNIKNGYLLFGWKKVLNKKNIKKVTNMVYRKKIAKTVINSVDDKRPMEVIINPAYGEQFLLINIYNLVRSGSMSLIN
ncbi:hypothetical protein YYG_04772 [Plasmodium vinckei petteri]|uniref:Uncharacterized protein n=1 Tax=Plasmodium vinckei petteri TaxID=138298 RepID=W7AN37_PLAVN|nr:hypothetical protein YYG_04772 [Plasmodium vinckei petteri]